MKTPLQVAIDADVGPVWDREEAIARAGMLEALRWVASRGAPDADASDFFDDIRKQIEELEAP